MLRRFAREEEGVIAVVFAIMIVPVMGVAGMGIDYLHLVNVRDFMQIQADTAALGGAAAGPEDNTADWAEVFRDRTVMQYGATAWVASLEVEGEWTSEIDFRVRATIEVPHAFVSIVPGVPDRSTVVVESVARLTEPVYRYTAPTVSDLDPEAGDYNRISVYCYNAVEDVRGELFPIADNAGTVFEYEMPICGPGEAMSYMLHNTRFRRTEPHRWFHPNELMFQYFTDTRIIDGVEVYDIKCEGAHCPPTPSGGWAILETVMCDSLEECVNASPGGPGVIPSGRDRDPVQAADACAPGKFMYYGWEDRPPGMPGAAHDWTYLAWTDRDYDDIRIVIACPTVEQIGHRNVRLVG